MRSLNAVALAALVGNTMAFWRMGCRARSGLVRLDPLVTPGGISEHMHAIHGSSGFSATATYEELMAGDCTSCEVAEDKSAYWHPALYFKDSATGKFSLVPQVGGMLAYYLLYPNAGNTTITSFPAGFQMIAGDTNQRNFTYPVPDIEKSLWNSNPYNTQAFLRQAALGFNCLNYAKAPEGALYRHFLPDKAYLDSNCVDGVRFELMFPSCWNGNKDIPPNKMDHMAYPSQVMTGECPEGFQERVPSLFYEIIWNTFAFKDKQGQFVLANGDPTGYGFHADFIMGWDEELLRKAVNTCTNLSGLTSDCPLFTMQDPSVYNSCNLTKIPAVVAEEEKIITDMDNLPGNLPIQPGPAYAIGETAGAQPAKDQKPNPAPQPQAPAPPAPAPPAPAPAPPAEQPAPPVEAPPAPAEPVKEPSVPVLSYSAGSSIAPSATYAPGGIVGLHDDKPAVAAVAEPAPTPAPENKKEDADNKDVVSTEYRTDGREITEVYWVEEVVVAMEASTYTSTTTVMEPPLRKRSHLLHHRHHYAGM
ncbi:hypothetical protein BGT96224_1694 [Blumeria graminis f. sp. tritici 96224]|uniref:DUF1996 domain-containing protein n=1 Tax=Blumeria graminis f. sp. tritici 96224 TaxID=1268274 RepID=A0A656KQ92_BLUGR|nr:hypothetical protein BGT96224_1694 [Blumeria graminis f. sp. tritici 96224]